MELNQLLSERLLTGEFKFGFELEAIIKGPFDGDDYDEAYEQINSFVDRYFPQSAGVDSDESIEPSDDDDIPFEWPSPILELTPASIQKSIEFLSALDGAGIYTNNSCGFHVHVSFPHISTESSGWLLLSLALNNKMRERISHFKQYSFLDRDYASDEYLDEIAYAYMNARENNNWDDFWNSFRKIVSDEKYRNLRVHPQGTIEWRGPRGFLEQKNQQYIKEFFILLVMFVRWMSSTLDAKHAGQISREEYDRRMKENSVSAKFKTGQGGRWSPKQKKQILPEVFRIAPWLRKAKFSGANVEIYEGKLIWNDGTWEGGTWVDGIWRGGYWQNGIWENGKWQGGTWVNGTWKNGTWVSGYWQNGHWMNGVWMSGMWMNGNWDGGRWLNGKIRGNPSTEPPVRK